MNLLEKTRWNFEYPWGSIINPDTGNEICISEKLVKFQPDGSLRFGCAHGACSGWKTDKNGFPTEGKSQWSVGAIISKDEHRTGFGTYHFVFRLPDFRGSWPAIWLIDLHPAPPKGDGMGIPPEVDIFEHFRKDGFLTRFQLTHNFHQGPSYANNTIISKKYWKFLPLDFNDIELTFSWTSAGMNWIVNGKNIMSVPGNTPNYPARPMNLIINAGLGLDWGPKPGKLKDFIVYKATYQP